MTVETLFNSLLHPHEVPPIAEMQEILDFCQQKPQCRAEFIELILSDISARQIYFQQHLCAIDYTSWPAESLDKVLTETQLWMMILLGEFRDASAIPALINLLVYSASIYAECAAYNLVHIGLKGIPALCAYIAGKESATNNGYLYAYAALARISKQADRADQRPVIALARSEFEKQLALPDGDPLAPAQLLLMLDVDRFGEEITQLILESNLTTGEKEELLALINDREDSQDLLEIIPATSWQELAYLLSSISLVELPGQEKLLETYSSPFYQQLEEYLTKLEQAEDNKLGVIYEHVRNYVTDNGMVDINKLQELLVYPKCDMFELLTDYLTELEEGGRWEQLIVASVMLAESASLNSMERADLMWRQAYGNYMLKRTEEFDRLIDQTVNMINLPEATVDMYLQCGDLGYFDAPEDSLADPQRAVKYYRLAESILPQLSTSEATIEIARQTYNKLIEIYAELSQPTQVSEYYAKIDRLFI